MSMQMPWLPRGAAMAAAVEEGSDEGEAAVAVEYSPWFRLFQNAYAFSMAGKKQ